MPGFTVRETSPTPPVSTEFRRPRSGRSVPSLIKWTGSKRSQAARIAALIPPYRCYYEPFIGGGAMLYLAGHAGAVAADMYAPLIELWRLLQSRPGEVVADYGAQWQRLQRGVSYYYEVRGRFNEQPNPLDLNFLLRTCVNGIVRFNRRGEFNNSYHLSRRGMQPERFAAAVARWMPVIQGVRFECQDYEATVASAGRGDFVYLDPPYAGNYQRYVSDLDIKRFWGVLDGLNSRGVLWALSFDGGRGEHDLTHAVPCELYRRRVLLACGVSAVHKVLNGPLERVQESLYLNY